MMVETMKTLGPDSFAGRLACVIQGSTETTFYILAVYSARSGSRTPATPCSAARRRPGGLLGRSSVTYLSSVIGRALQGSALALKSCALREGGHRWPRIRDEGCGVETPLLRNVVRRPKRSAVSRLRRAHAAAPRRAGGVRPTQKRSSV